MPEDIALKFHEEINKFEEAKNMPYITTAERIGMQKGEQMGMLKGKLEGKLETAANLLEIGIDIKTIAKATGLTEKEIKNLKQPKKAA